MEGTQRKIRVAWLSVFSNASLVAGKLAAGLFIGSVSVISEAIHSGIDLAAAVIALVAVRRAARSPDERHPYGHGKIENVSGTIEAILIFGAAAWIIYEALHKLAARRPVEGLGLGIAVMAVSAAANYAVSSMLFKVGRETDSIALQADGWHLRTDVWTSLGVLAGLSVVALGERLLPRVPLWWVDPVAAIVVALLILKAAWDLTRHSLRDLLDESLGEEENGWITGEIRRCPGVRDMHKLRTRRAGAQRFIDFHIQVDPELSVTEGHEVARSLKARLRKRFPGASVNIHVEPEEAEPAVPRGR